MASAVTATLRLIGTHSGAFHADEALAVGLLRQTSAFKDAAVIRSRDPKEWAKCDILVDVGDEYNPTTHRYDHHQRGFAETFDGAHRTKLSSAGLIYKHFGREVVAGLLGDATAPTMLDRVYMKVYDGFVEALDGGDNGIPQYDESIEPNYQSGGTDLASRVANLNPGWNAKDVDPQPLFEKAVALATSDFVDRITFYREAWLPAREIVVSSFAARNSVHPSGMIVVISTGCPWGEHLSDLEEEAGLAGHIKYALFADGTSWRVRAVAAKKGSFECRAALPQQWRGLRNEALSEVVGVDGCVFVHANGFIGGHSNYEGAVFMATKALELNGCISV